MAVEFKSSLDKKNKWIKCISHSGTIRAIAISAHELINFMLTRKPVGEAGATALAESVLSGLILSSYCKSGEKVNLNIKGSGWCKQTIIDANADAEVRGYIIERDPSEIHLAKGIGPWGIGLLSVLRTKADQTQPYIGTVPLLTGHLAKDLTFYWLQSEQVQSAVGLEVHQKDGKISLAEGFLIQALPGATDADITFIEDHLKRLQNFSPNSKQKNTPLNLLSYLLENQTFSILEEKALSFKCSCTLERVKRSLSLVGTEEIQAMIQESKNTEISCDFCAEKYCFTPEMLRELL